MAIKRVRDDRPQHEHVEDKRVTLKTCSKECFCGAQHFEL